MKFKLALGAAAFAASTMLSPQASAQITLRASAWVSPAHPLTVTMMAWCDDVTKGTAGRVRCELLPKPPMGAFQTFDGVRDGLSDLSFTVHGYTPGRFPLSQMAEFPFLGDTAEITSVAFQRMYDRTISKFDEHKGVHTLAVYTHGPGQMFNSRRAINTLKDLEGLKIRVGGGLVNEIAKLIGAVPMLRPAPESYELLSSGVADGVFFPKESPVAFRLVPLIRHITYVPGGLYNTSFMQIIHPATWNRIPAADREIMQKLSGEALARRIGQAWDAADTKGEAAVREAKIPIVIAGPALIEEIRQRTAGIERTWLETVKARGADGEALLRAFRAEIAALSKR